MLELLNQLDGFQPNADIKVIAATNRVDILDPALLRSGRLDRKIEFPHPNEEARARIMQIHSRKMNVRKDVNFEELSRCTDDFNGAQCKAVCIEAVSSLRSFGLFFYKVLYCESFLGYDCFETQCQWSDSRRLHGCHSWSPSKKENQPQLLCLKNFYSIFFISFDCLLYGLLLFSFLPKNYINNIYLNSRRFFFK